MSDYFFNEILLPQETFKTSQFPSTHPRKPYHFNRSLFLLVAFLDSFPHLGLSNIGMTYSQKSHF